MDKILRVNTSYVELRKIPGDTTIADPEEFKRLLERIVSTLPEEMEKATAP